MIVQCRAAAALREREQAPPLSVLQIFRSVVDDPVARAAPAPADIIDPDLHRRPEPESANNNPLNGDVDQQPYSRLEPVGLGIGERYVLVLIACSASASRARVKAAIMVKSAKFC